MKYFCPSLSPLRSLALCLVIGLETTLPGLGQTVDTLSTNEKALDELVVTATRSERELGSLPLPVTVIPRQQIRQMGSLRLNDVLAEQTGLFMVNDHGTGVQIQGFNPDYTLILVDGEPLIGRTAGTLELSRVAVGNIKRIEIVKGPSSSLYGSEALAGVINIITQNPDRANSDLSVRYGANRTLDLSASAGFRRKRLGLQLFGNRYATQGYDLSPDTFGSTVAPFHNFTIQPKLTYQFSERTKLAVSQRIFGEIQQNSFAISEGGTSREVAGEGRVHDANTTATLTHRFDQHFRLQARTYFSQYRTESSLAYRTDGVMYDRTFFRQSFLRPELQADWSINAKNLFTGGIGHIAEGVEATRYTQPQRFGSYYAFAQYEYFPTNALQIILGGRFDAHSAYRNQFSPKLAVAYQLTDRLLLRGSAGVGFKAPDFRQLYLNFTNAVAGYSVFGSQELAAGLLRLQQQGQVAEVLSDPSAFGLLRPESSRAVNLGAQYRTTSGFGASVNLFRNDIRDLIETQAVAQKTNGQSVFSYLNLNRVFTQGGEVEASRRWEAGQSGLTLSAGYQYLEAKDKEVLEKIRNHTLFRRNPETLATERVPRADYGGLMGRSRHSANVKLFYQSPNGLSASLRGIYRGRYGFGDRNSNTILDSPDEYVRGYVLWHVSAAKTLGCLMLQAGVDNLLNFRNAAFIPSQPGRLGWLRLSATLTSRAPEKTPEP
ncbi:TonB-dependent receptor plug domain-containing protein [Salmonirosea aquatica]|uniref:TonB-dependent receptor n=1 Tax=Salmonirosea aquatica TaxID=2654236 RepID=A0A7C9BMJ4_9BACT|nr:TonB-dependent receptor [Cytophagaceae bacterium SJW1-29]